MTNLETSISGIDQLLEANEAVQIEAVVKLDDEHRKLLKEILQRFGLELRFTRSKEEG